MTVSFAGLGRLVTLAAVVLGSWGASPALAQRAISNSNNGNDRGVARAVDRLVGCEIANTFATIDGIHRGGAADACAGLLPTGEATSAVEALAASYSGTRAYGLVLVNTTADRLRAADSVSSGGLFETVAGGGLGGASVGLHFLRQETGNFMMAFSGRYDDGVLGNVADVWSGYFVFDNVDIALDGRMNFTPFDYRERTDPSTGDTTIFRDSTRSLVIDQVSIYQLQRVPVVGSLWLVGVGLAALAATRRRRPAGAKPPQR